MKTASLVSGYSSSPRPRVLASSSVSRVGSPPAHSRLRGSTPDRILIRSKGTRFRRGRTTRLARSSPPRCRRTWSSPGVGFLAPTVLSTTTLGRRRRTRRLRLLLMTTWCSTQTYRSHGENKSSGRRRRRRRRSRRCGGGVRRAVCEHHPPRQERSRFTQMLSSPHFIHHVRTVKAKAALSPLLTACVMMMSRGSPKKRTRAAKRESLRNLFRVYVCVAKNRSLRTSRQRTGFARRQKTVFFASFGDFFPALWVPTISEHLLALSLLKRSAHLRDSKEKNARRDFRRTHVSQNFCPRAREHYAPQSYCIRFFIYTNYTLRDGDVSGTIGDFFEDERAIHISSPRWRCF